ncbi:MAG: glycosyl hydrolase family 18 protein [Flavobacteriales bacterium]
MKHLLYLSFVFLFSFSQAQVVIDEPIVLGYFPSWSESWASQDQNSSLREIPSYVNYVFLAFGKPDLTYTQGTYDISQTGIQVPYDGCALKESVSALNDKGVKVILSIGGETYWTSSTIYDDINYQQIKDLVDDMGFAGIDWDFEPNGSFGNIGSAANVHHYIDFFTNSRALMPRSEGYIMACAPSGVGALGGQLNNDATSPFSYANRNTVTGESDANLYNSAAQTNGINLYGFSSTGHMIPVMQAVGNEIDIIAYQGYNAGGSQNRSIMYDAYAYYAETHGFKIAAGVHFPEEPWGPYYTYTHENVASLSEHIATHPDRVGDNDGIMIWQLLMSGSGTSGYAYMNVADRVLNGEATTSAVSNAQNFSVETYSGGAEGCSGGQTGGYCGYAEYNASNNYSNPGMHVYYNCGIWRNQWWANPGESPGSDNNWVYVSECNEGPGCVTGVDEPSSSVQFSFNRASNILSLSGVENHTKISITNMVGQEIVSFNLASGNAIRNLDHLATGVYAVVVATHEDRWVFSFVKD